MNKLNIKHLYSRAGFGISYTDLNAKSDQDIKKVIKTLFSDSAHATDIKVVDVYTPKSAIKKALQMTPNEKRDLLKQQREAVRTLNTTWLQQLFGTQAVLREKVALLWHGHFACRTQNPYFAQQLNNIMREHGMGDFRKLLVEVSKTPAMLQFLNNQQNRKGHANENFARELMELFTLGRGNYTENDIKESARAFTGWMFNGDGEFQFRDKVHDEGQKTFFGKTGNFGGEDIIDAILQRPACAEFIAGKFYRFFVNDTPDAARIKELGQYYFDKKYDTTALLQRIFTSDWFYSKENVGNKIKSPIELITGLSRQFGISYENPKALLVFQQALGQVLFYPPNVAGWAGGKNWIDSSSLMVRLKIPSLVLNSGIIDFKGKADPEDEAELAMRQAVKKAVDNRVKTQANWDAFIAQFPPGTNAEQLAGFLLQAPAPAELLAILKANNDIKAIAIALVSTPEYQLA